MLKGECWYEWLEPFRAIIAGRVLSQRPAEKVIYTEFLTAP
jgi:hypothetical protein